MLTGTFLMPNATVAINQLNTALSAVAAKNISMNTSPETEGPDGVFNPPAFGDPNNHGGVTETDSLKATVKKTSNGEDTTSDFSELPNLNFGPFKYDDVANFSIAWTGYSGASLYESTDGKNWKVQATKVSDDQGDTFTQSVSPGHNLNVASTVTTGSTTEPKSTTVEYGQTVFTATPADNMYYFALATGDPNVSTNVKWQSEVTLNVEKFSLAVPTRMMFTNIVGTDTNYLTVQPDDSALIELDNALNAPFSLTTTINSSKNTTSSGPTNVFLNNLENAFTYNLVDLNGDNPPAVFNEVVKDGILTGTEPPLKDDSETQYRLSGFVLKVPLELRNDNSTIGLDWNLTLGSQAS